MSLGIEVIDLVAAWGPTVVLDGISLAVRPGGTPQRRRQDDEIARAQASAVRTAANRCSEPRTFG
jgi:hypothetical protein